MPLEIDSQIRAQVESLYADRVRPQMDREQQYSFAKMRKSNLYWNGAQNLVPLYSRSLGFNVDYIPASHAGGLYSPQIETAGDYTMNRYRANCRKFVSVLGNKEPSLKCIPLDDANIPMVRLSRAIDGISAQLDRSTKRGKQHTRLSQYLFLYGTSWIYTPYVTDQQKYGFYTLPEFSMNEVMGDGGAEFSLTETQASIPKGMQEYIVVPPTEASCPYGISDFHKAPWFFYEFEEYTATLLGAYPEWEEVILSQDKSMSGMGYTSLEGRRLREQVGSPTYSELMDRYDKITLTQLWLAPGMLRLLPDEGMRREFLEAHPNGARVTFIGGRMVDIIPEYFADVWTPVKPEESDTIHADGIGKDYMEIQDMQNDGWNIMTEALQRMFSMIFYDPQAINEKAIRMQRPGPAQMFPMTPRAGQGGSTILQEVGGSPLDPNVPNIVSAADDKGSDIIGITPQLSGAGEGAQTAKEYELRMNAALRQLTITWKNIREAEAEAQWKAIKNWAKSRIEPFVVGGDYIDPQDVLNAEVSFEAEEFIPKTFGERRDMVREMLDRGPEFWPICGITLPVNAESLNSYLGLIGWEWPGVNESRKIQGVIEELLMSEPVDMGMGPMPSISPDPIEDDLQMVVQICRYWMSSPQGVAAKKMSPGGFENVKAYMVAADQIIQQQMMAQAPMEEPVDGDNPPEEAEVQNANPVQGSAPPALDMAVPLDPSMMDPNMLPGGGPIPSAPLADQLMPV